LIEEANQDFSLRFFLCQGLDEEDTEDQLKVNGSPA